VESIGEIVPDAGTETINEPDEPQKIAGPSSPDLEEDEVSFQLAPAPSSPLPSESAPIVEKSLVPMYPDRESSPSVEAKQEPAGTSEGSIKADSMKLTTPSPSPEPPQDRNERETSQTREPEESTSRNHLPVLHVIIRSLILFQVSVQKSLCRSRRRSVPRRRL
jgi:hypothetical protein